MGAEAERLEKIVAELLRVTEGLIQSRVSFDTTTEYLMETTDSLDHETMRRVLILLVLEVIKERIANEQT